MLKVNLSPLDSETARLIAERRGISVVELVSNLLREEAAIELTGWRKPAQSQPAALLAGPEPQPREVPA